MTVSDMDSLYGLVHYLTRNVAIFWGSLDIVRDVQCAGRGHKFVQNIGRDACW